MPLQKVREFLDSRRVKYVCISHSLAYTAQEVAASAHIPGKEMAKTVIVRIDGKLAMAVLPAPYHVDFELLKEATGAECAELASEEDFRDIFPDCVVGVMPPFGNLYGLDVYMDESLAEDEEIAFNAGSHKEIIRMAFKDFEEVVERKRAKFGLKP